MVHPRLRGKLSEYGFRSCTSVRFIPAYAGNSDEEKLIKPSKQVHPRLRGKLQRGGACPVGSIRYIPAYAGNSIKRYSFRRGYAVHPRLRGKLSFSARACCFSIGSSPLTRETLPPKENPLSSGRFIPAYAGNSVSLQAVQTNSLVHPRLRGKLIPESAQWVNDFGSSPLTRETHLKWLQHYTNRLTAKLLKNISKQE